MERYIFTSESVTEGHPDKLCDRISDAVLDAFIAQDATARVACECAATTGTVLVMGEVTTDTWIDLDALVRATIAEVGYTQSSYGINAYGCAVLPLLHPQSPDIAMGVDRALEARQGEAVETLGAGDQGMMFGYACDETPELMPMALSFSHALTRRLAQARKSGEMPFLRPDGKAQVSIVYEDGHPVAIDTVVVSTQHAEDIAEKALRDAVLEGVIRKSLPERYLRPETRIFINPTGRFVMGGPAADSGLTGRKIIVDTYGGAAPHGGGAFSGKDPTKVDRSAAYMARYAALNVVAAGLAGQCELQVAYAIGVAQPVSLRVNTRGTGKVADAAIADAVSRTFDLRPAAIIEQLGLRRPIYTPLTSYGHFGRPDLDLPWERRDKADALAKLV